MPNGLGLVEQLSWVLRYVSRTYLREPWWAEFWSGLIAIGWAIAFAISNESLAESAPNTFRVLEALAPGWIWAWWCLFAGIAQIVFLLLDMRMTRWFCAIVAATFPCTAVASMVLSDHLVEHIAVYGGWAGINIFSIFRLLRRVP